MSRKPTSFDDFMREVEAEVRAAGPEAEAQAEAVRTHFRLASQVLRLRKQLRLTQQQLADRVGVHQSEISDIERGAASPGYRLLVRLAHGLNAEVALVPRRQTSRRSLKRQAGARPMIRVQEHTGRV